MSKEYFQCGRTRKCKWVGTKDELVEVEDPDFQGFAVYNLSCPKCGNLEHYILNEEEYQKVLDKRK